MQGNQKYLVLVAGVATTAPVEKSSSSVMLGSITSSSGLKKLPERIMNEYNDKRKHQILRGGMMVVCIE